MEHQLATIASELYELETQYGQSGLNSTQTERWNHLVKEFVTALRTDGERRRNTRVPGEMELTVKKGTETITCKLEDMSHHGLKVRGDFAKAFKKGDDVEVESITIDGKTEPLHMNGKLAWKQGRWSGGIMFTENSPESRKRFFDSAYYPLYLRYLKTLSQN